MSVPTFHPKERGHGGGGSAYPLLTFCWPTWSYGLTSLQGRPRNSLWFVQSQMPRHSSILEEVLGQVAISATGTIK